MHIVPCLFEAVDFFCQVEVLGRNAAGIVAHKFKMDLVVTYVDVRVMAGFLGTIAHGVDEGQRSPEVGKFIGARQFSGVELPAGKFPQARIDFIGGERVPDFSPWREFASACNFNVTRNRDRGPGSVATRKKNLDSAVSNRATSAAGPATCGAARRDW